MLNIENNIFLEIKETIEKIFPIKILDYEIINKGLLNLKWKVKTTDGPFFIKQFNEERYPTSDEKRLNSLNTALLTQKGLSEEGIRCPHILTFNGDIMLTTKENIRFIITEYIDGNLVNAGKINCNQFSDLGMELGKIHRLINKQNDEKAIPRWVVPTKEQLIADWNETWLSINTKNSDHINTLLKLQREIFESLDMNIFQVSKPGWAHSDLWCDNVLFYNDSLSSIIDFDRFQYIYPELDLSRAILSFALDNNCLRLDAVKSFMDGYNVFGNITDDDIVRSLRLLYCEESFWWLNDHSFNSEGPPKRFAEEMMWLSLNWTKLEKILRELKN